MRNVRPHAPTIWLRLYSLKLCLPNHSRFSGMTRNRLQPYLRNHSMRRRAIVRKTLMRKMPMIGSISAVLGCLMSGNNAQAIEAKYDPNQCSNAPLEFRSPPVTKTLIVACETKNKTLYLGAAGAAAGGLLIWLLLDRTNNAGPKTLSWGEDGSWSYQYKMESGITLIRDFSLAKSSDFRGKQRLEIGTLGFQSTLRAAQLGENIRYLGGKYEYRVNFLNVRYKY
jgi:hypothetical protein